MAYSFLDVDAKLVGAGAILDLGAGSKNAQEGITITRLEDDDNMLIGADGEGMHSLRANKSGQVTINLLQDSPVNQQLQNLYNAQKMSSSAWGQNIITITQKASGDVTVCRSCAFSRVPDLSYQQDGGVVAWVFNAIKIDTIRGKYPSDVPEV